MRPDLQYNFSFCPADSVGNELTVFGVDQTTGVVPASPSVKSSNANFITTERAWYLATTDVTKNPSKVAYYATYHSLGLGGPVINCASCREGGFRGIFPAVFERFLEASCRHGTHHVMQNGANKTPQDVVRLQ